MVEILDGWYFKIDEFQYVLVHKYEKAKECLARSALTAARS